MPNSKFIYKDGWAIGAIVGGALVGALLRDLTVWVWGSLLGVLVANLVGAIILGFVTPMIADRYYLRRLVATGLLGTFTTYSSLMILTINTVSGLIYLLLTLGLGMLCALFGLFLGYILTHKLSITINTGVLSDKNK